MSDDLIELICWITALAGSAYVMITFIYIRVSQIPLSPWGLY